jgi:hypothetical protein
VGQNNGANVFRVDGTGKGYFDGGTQTGGADFAESVAVRGDRVRYEPGDLLAIDPTGSRRLDLSQDAYSTRVAGIYSTKPGILASTHAMDDSRLAGEVPLAVVGIVPCKVTPKTARLALGDMLGGVFAGGLRDEGHGSRAHAGRGGGQGHGTAGGGERRDSGAGDAAVGRVLPETSTAFDMAAKQYKVGSKCGTGQVIASILGQSAVACVYTTTDNHLRWEYFKDRGALPKALKPAISRFDAQMARIRELSNVKDHKPLFELLGKSLFSALDSGLAESVSSYFRPVERMIGDHMRPKAAAKRKRGTRRVFIVHGRDDGAKEGLARFLAQIVIFDGVPISSPLSPSAASPSATASPSRRCANRIRASRMASPTTGTWCISAAARWAARGWCSRKPRPSSRAGASRPPIWASGMTSMWRCWRASRGSSASKARRRASSLRTPAAKPARASRGKAARRFRNPKGGWRTVAPSDIPFRPGEPAPAELSKSEIGAIVEAFAAATRRAAPLDSRWSRFTARTAI